MAILLHAIFVLMMMDDGERRLICLVSSLGHVSIRPIGIAFIGTFKSKLEADLPTSLHSKILEPVAV